MNGLRVKQESWEEICTYLMEQILRGRHNATVRHDLFGRRGQRQFGIDLVCNHPDYAGIVAQCKHKSEGRVLTWKAIQKELEETDKYTHSITHYYVLTTSKSDTSVHLGLQECGSKYNRKNGETFEIKIIYWDKIENISFIPKHKLREFFPVAARVAEYLKTPVDYKEYAASIDVMQHVIGSAIREEDISRIQEENFIDGFIIEDSFRPFRELNIDMMKAVYGMSAPDTFLFNPRIRALTMCFPAARLFANALQDFCNIVKNDTIGGNISLGYPAVATEVLRFDDRGPRFQREAYSRIYYAAKSLRARYHRDVLGIDY